jgi:hypothetical protein
MKAYKKWLIQTAEKMEGDNLELNLAAVLFSDLLEQKQITYDLVFEEHKHHVLPPELFHNQNTKIEKLLEVAKKIVEDDS